MVMDILVSKNRKYDETGNKETVKRNDFDESCSKKERFFIGESTSNEKAVHSSCENHVPHEYTENFNDIMARKRKTAENREKVDVNKNTHVKISLVDRLRNIKQQSAKKYAARRACLKDAQISAKTFEQSARVLDEVYNLTPSDEKLKNKIHPLGLVPFVMVKRCDENKGETEKNQGSADRWSMDEDKEEDMFADPKEDRETIVEFSQWEYVTSRGPDKLFCGFPDSESQRSKEIGEKCTYLVRVEEMECEDKDDTPPLNGFTSIEINASKSIATSYKFNLVSVEAGTDNVSEITSIVKNSSLAERRFSLNSDDNNLNEIPKIERWKTRDFLPDQMTSLRQSQVKNCRIRPILPDEMVSLSLSQVNNCFTQPILPDQTISPQQSHNICQSDLPKRGSLSEFSINLPCTSYSESPSIGQAKGISEGLFEKVKTLSSRGISSIQNDSSDNCVSEDTRKSINSSKLTTDSSSSYECSTAARRRISVEVAVVKDKDIYDEEISNLKEELDDKSILQGIKESSDSSKLETNVPSPCGFKTASGRTINVSESAILKEQRVYSELNVREASASDEQTPKCKTEERINECNPSFNAAPRDQLKISERRVTYDTAVLPESNDFVIAETECNRTDESLSLQKRNKSLPETNSLSKFRTDSPSIFGFTTAAKRPINVSETALEKAQNVYSEVIKNVELGIDSNSNLNSNSTELKSSSKIAADPRMIGFTTAANRPIKVSETALKKAHRVYSEEIKNVDLGIDDNSNLNSNSTEFKSSSKIANPSMIGFSTAAKRSINVSETALKKAQNLYSEVIKNVELGIDDNRNLRSDSAEFKSSSKIVNPSMIGFTTAAKRPIEVSETALKKAQNVYSEVITKVELGIDDNSNLNSNSIEFKSSSKIAADPSTIGFTTAAKRPLKVSESALEKAKITYAKESLNVSNEPIDIYDTEDTPESKQSSKLITTNPANHCGFSTAGGRVINISNAALIKEQKAYLELVVPNATSHPEDTLDRKIDDNRGNRFPVSATNTSKTEDFRKKASSITNFPLASKNDTPITRNRNINVPSPNLTTEFENFESLNIDDFIDPIEDDQPSKKRKIDADDETPLRRDTFVKLKRGRYASELQARKLFLEDTINEEEALTKRSKSEEAFPKFESPNRKTSTVTPEKILISKEVHASTAALLEDERSNEATEWIMKESSLVDAETKPETVVAKKSNSPKIAIDGRAAESNRFRAEALSSPNKKRTAERNSLDIKPESIPDDLAFDTQFSEDNECCPALDNFIAETMKMMEARLAMTRKQDETIRAKKRTKPEHCDGYFYKLRMSNKNSRISWKELTKGAAPAPREMSESPTDSDVLSITANSAASYSFRCSDLFGSKNIDKNAEGIKVGDDAFLILDENNRAGVREFERAFLASPGVDPSLIPTGWVKNHYRWIVWKLASMDRVDFNNKCLPRMLTPDRVMFELKYRYDREIYGSQWPPLRRILERNEDASARIVLCVASISIREENVKAPIRTPNTPNSMGGASYKMKLTDGWYCIDAEIDAAMVDCIKSGKVKVGTKIITAGAKAMNLDQGCSVLEIPNDVALKIHTNSTRRVRWNTKLDYYHPNRGPMPLSLKSIKPNGGLISKLVVAVARLYPILYREKLPDGQLVFRNARCDEEAALAYETQHQSKIEEIYANARMEFQSALENKRGRGKRSRNSMEQTASSYRELEEELRERIASKLRECLPPPRDVTPVMKIRIAEGETSAMLTVWSNDRDTTKMFVEGSLVVIYNAFASRQRLNGLHITVGRSSFVKSDAKRQVSYPERIYTPIMEIGEPGFNPVYGEFDTIGIVSSIGPAPHGMKNFETVNLACPRTPEGTSSYLSILFWQGVSTHGYSKILAVGSLVACCNLEWRKNPVKSIPTAYSTERSVFSKNPRQNHLSKAFETLRLQIQEPLAYAASCATVIEEEIAKKSALRTPCKGTPYNPATSNNTTPGWTPRDMKNSINANCTPVNDSRKISNKRRIEKLEAYGEAPKLPSIVVNQSSRKVLSDFRSPVVTPVRKS